MVAKLSSFRLDPSDMDRSGRPLELDTPKDGHLIRKTSGYEAGIPGCLTR